MFLLQQVKLSGLMGREIINMDSKSAFNLLMDRLKEEMGF